jgi:hypothetical protein
MAKEQKLEGGFRERRRAKKTDKARKKVERSAGQRAPHSDEASTRHWIPSGGGG